MIKNAIYTFGGANQDLSKSKHLPQYYFEAGHIKLLATDSQSTSSLTNEKGNELVLSIPKVTINKVNKIIYYNDKQLPYINTEIENIEDLVSEDQVIIGHSETREGIILFTTNNKGFDCIWLVDNVLNNSYELKLLYVRNLDFNINKPIQALFNYENDNIQKVYWVDGSKQVRFINTQHSIDNGDKEELINLPLTTINFVGNFNLNQPIITDINSGGIHTSGKIQYAYNLFKLNSSQTVISPLSELISLDKGNNQGGGEVNEIVGSIPVVQIDDIDTTYTNLKLYAIKYTSFNEIPQISLILETNIDNNSITYYDDGTVINNLSLEEFLFLGGSPIIPKHIEAKDNRLLLSNIKEINFDVDIDTRAYSFPSISNITEVYDNVKEVNGNITGDRYPVSIITYSNVPEKHDSVNIDYEINKYQPGTTILGGEGRFLKYELTPTELTDSQAEENTFFKSEEIYRTGIKFYNRLGQSSFPKWIADIKAPKANLNGLYNILKVTLKPEFYVWLNTSSNFESEDDKPIGYKIIRADRTLSDRTIMYQGVLSSMIFQLKGEEAKTDNFPIDITDIQDQELKIPSYFIRNFENSGKLFPELYQIPVNSGRGEIVRSLHGSRLNAVEIHSNEQNSGKVSQTFQFSKMMQLHSPDVQFEFTSIRSDLQLKVNGLAQMTEEYIQSKEVILNSSLEKFGGKFQFFPTRQFLENNNMKDTFDTPNSTSNPRYIGPSGDIDTTDFYQLYRAYNDYVSSSTDRVYDIYGSPEIAERGQGRKNYNGNAKYAYANSLESFISDGEDNCNDCPALVSMNSWSTKNITLMLGDESIPTGNRSGIEDIFNDAGDLPTNGILSVDIKIPANNVYLNNIYGGNTYEAKTRSVYIDIGEYKTITSNEITILSPGDTYVQNYQFLRIGKTDTEVLNTRIPQISEIVSFPVETTVDLKNRNDLSLFNWDNRFQPKDEEYHKYNRVYSQQPTLIKSTAKPDNFRKVESFDTRIQATKLKIPNETIDSWTDILVNEVIDLEGVYGPINNIKVFKDRLISFQDKAISNISVNPRIQVQANDGVAIELGRGSVLYDYDYITTQSGSINKWSILETKKGIYYYDLLNKAIGRIPDATNTFLSDIKGQHSFFNNNYNYNLLKTDNPLIKKGVVFGYDNYNNDVYFTLHLNNNDGIRKDDKSFTWCYNELKEEFIDLKPGYIPSHYINQGEKLILTNPDNNKLYEQYKGEYNKFFDKYEPSYITLMVNPEANKDCVFNNIMYKSELYLRNVDQPKKTLTGIQAYNEYQDTGLIPLKLSRNLNLRRKFRDWKANIPKDGRDRIRNPWMFLKLELDNEDNYKMILHDIIVFYSTY